MKDISIKKKMKDMSIKKKKMKDIYIYIKKKK